MIVLTDDVTYSLKYFPVEEGLVFNYGAPLTSKFENEFFNVKQVLSYHCDNKFWKYGFVTEYSEKSQFDILTNLSSGISKLPDKIFCLAGYGKKFHGFRNRHWVSELGNIHLSCYFKPYFQSSETGLGFTMLAAVSVIETLDLIEGLEGKSQIKWVNDIIVNDAKICGVIAQTQIQGKHVTDAVIGIGLNVGVVPDIYTTSFVPQATSINANSKKTQDIKTITNILLEKIALNYDILAHKGYKPILEKYRQRSMITGKHVKVWSDPVDEEPVLIHEGRVESIGDYLELYLENQKMPVTSGRIVHE
ncbi:MAG: biotin--[acetyl-CoA-carboxylase] ligase [Candidatus Kapabacteria bacterium]|nr:biotin--[acetyl-CoA-carboxylase] ligase [Candidatus Kapabacteria bacterium]